MAEPPWLPALERAYGAPSADAFGSAVFNGTGDLDAFARASYRQFMGSAWSPAYEGHFDLVYRRPAGAGPDVVGELAAVDDPAASLSIPMLTEVIEDQDAATRALVSAFDDQATTSFAVWSIGDGATMNGVVLGAAHNNGVTALVFILD